MLQHLKTFKCKTYFLIKLKEDSDYSEKLQKLALRAHIRYLVEYKSILIYRVWILYKRKVISTQDVIFNKEEFYNKKVIWISQELSISLDETIDEIALPAKKSLEKMQLQTEEALEIGEDQGDSEQSREIENLKDIKDIDQEQEQEGVQDLKEEK